MKILAYILSSIYYFLFGLTLVIWHPIQWLCYNLDGYSAHHNCVKAMNWTLFQITKILGTTYKFSGREKIPTGIPIIFVCNHQSMHDIAPLEWYVADFHPKFISKIELGKGIPSVSYNLKKGGSALINRKDSRQALPEIKKLGEYIEKNNYSAILFPEGTRSKDGQLKPFKDMGLKILVRNAPSALIVPVTINNSWKMVQNGSFPLSLGIAISIEIHNPISFKDQDFEQMMLETRQAIQRTLKN